MVCVTHYDLVIIGAGSGNMIVNRGYDDLHVATVEECHFGGTCLNVGCIPTKMFVVPADRAREAVDGPRLGVATSYDGVDWPAVRDRIFTRIDADSDGARDWRVRAPNHTVYDGRAEFTGERTLRITRPDGGDETVTADQIVVAAGRRPALPDIPGLDEVEVHTSDTVMRLPELPASMLIVGAGVVAAEFAHIFSAYGTTVVQVARGDRVLRDFDTDVSTAFTAQAGAQWDLRLGQQVAGVRRTAAGVAATLDDGSEVEAAVLLVAIGRVSNADRLGVAAGGIATDAEGIIVVDEYQRTSAPGVWALGDIANHHQLKHVANHEARVIKHNLLHPGDLVAADHRAIPRAVFSSPRVATVGITEDQARAAGRGYVAAVQRYADVAYGWALEDTDHFAKVIADSTTGELLGAHILGPDAANLIQPLVQAMKSGVTAPELARGQYWIHPALTEVVENVLLKVRLR